LLELARKYKVDTIPVGSGEKNKEHIKISSVYNDHFNNKSWDYYDVLVETISNKRSAELKRLIQKKTDSLDRASFITEELFELKSQLITENNEVLINIIKNKTTALISEEENIGKTLEFIDGKIKEIKDDGISWWEQYDLQEEDLDIKLNEPSQFFQIREQQIFQGRLDNYSALASQDFISATFAQKMWFGLSDEEILQNRTLMQKDAAFRWELAQIETSGPDFREKALNEMQGAMEGGEGFDGLGGAGGGLPPGAGGDNTLPEFGAPPEGDNTGGEATPNADNASASNDGKPTAPTPPSVK